MDFPKYDGNNHPDEWINDIQSYFEIKKLDHHHKQQVRLAISLVDSTIKLPTGINSFEKLCNALKEDISFTVFKNTNERKLQSLKYFPERNGGDTSKFFLNFRKLCYNAEVNDIDEQKKYFYRSLPNNYFQSEFIKRKEKINSTNDLIKEFEVIVAEESNLIRDGYIVALKHVATGKYLSSIRNLRYTTGSGAQLVFVDKSEYDLNSLWKISFDEELVNYTDTYHITLQHVKSNIYLGINGYHHYKSPSSEHSEVSCNDLSDNNFTSNWKLNRSKLENQGGYFKSNDIINLSIMKGYNGQDEYLRSHDIQFTIKNNTFQEVVCHTERIGGNDEWCIELISTNGSFDERPNEASLPILAEIRRLLTNIEANF